MMRDLVDRTALVTGSSGGIGLETARGLAARGARVLLVGRDSGRLAAAARGIRESAPGARVTPLPADLSVQAEVRRLAGLVAAEVPALDLLIHNLGTVEPRRVLTAGGIERTLAVNHLAAFLLTALLREPLAASGSARVVTLSSAAHLTARLDLDDLQLTRGYRLSTAYARSKLANLLFHRELTRRLQGTATTTVAVDPGGARSGLATGPGIPLAYRLLRAVAPSPARAAEVVLHAAVDDGTTGRYLARGGAPARLSDRARDDAAAAALWTESRRLVGLPEHEGVR